MQIVFMHVSPKSEEVIETINKMKKIS